MSLPTKAKVVIIGGGIHGLSTAWKLSQKYKNPNDVIVLEKKDTAAGASGIACGVDALGYGLWAELGHSGYHWLIVRSWRIR